MMSDPSPPEAATAATILAVDLVTPLYAVSLICAALRADSLPTPEAPSAKDMRNTAERCYEDK